MQQRQLRLGDILDDYCPRERRVTNHAIVAMVEQDVKQTRCTTCETEHEYRQARVPPQRKRKDTSAALYAQVAAGAPKPAVRAAAPATDAESAPPLAAAASDDVDDGLPRSIEAAPEAAASDGSSAAGDEEEGRVHRQLIRATLPRPEGQPQTRPLPEFTIRQSPAGPSKFRPTGNGFRQPRSGARPFGGSPAGQGRHAGGRPGGHGPSGRRTADRTHKTGGPSRQSQAGSMARSGKKRSK
ncbi:MAG TPA: hypothetical protein VND92_08330, partial [Vicinamibacterales bacterium]|nr:hypothetical protein [Vicinamibacterales bacterium]